MSTDRLAGLGIDLIPEPQEVTARQGAWPLPDPLFVALPADADEDDRFAAADLAAVLAEEWSWRVEVCEAPAGTPAVRLSRRSGEGLRAEGYRLSVDESGCTIEGNDAAGLYWGTRTLLQAVHAGADGPEIPCLEVEDWPAMEHRAIHYDTKHHQGTAAYVEGLIRQLARYKVNMLVWEWEDKLAYERHPEIGAPGAFTKDRMRAFTALARRHHVELVPLVQGLGHVSFILKHAEHRHLREIPNSAWEFCPLKEGSYELLFDLWDEAMEATPGSRYLHIGSDETYELGLGEACGCRQRAEAEGKSSLMQLFLRRSAQHVADRGRRAMSWSYAPRGSGEPPPGMIFVDASDLQALEAAQQAGYDVMSYAPNPGIEPLFLGYFPWVQWSMWRPDSRRVRQGSFGDTSTTLAAAGKAGITFGSITTSWDDSGLHTQAWMPRFVCAAEYSWSSKGPEIETWIDRFLRQYFGPAASDLRELFLLLQEGALFYYDTFQRRVWHWGDIGKIHVPDCPRQEMEYHEFWCRRYAQLVHRALAERQHVARALAILDANLAAPVRNRYDLELYRTVAELMRHNVELVLTLAGLEEDITAAHKSHYSDRSSSLERLRAARRRIADHLNDRAAVFGELVAVWERTRLPKGMSTPEKPFVFAPDRARHFANRTPDMRYLILDEELLDLDGYLARLDRYVADYETRLDS